MCYTESIYFSIERGALGIEEVQYRDPLPAICKVSVMTSGDSAPYCKTRARQAAAQLHCAPLFSGCKEQKRGEFNLGALTLMGSSSFPQRDH